MKTPPLFRLSGWPRSAAAAAVLLTSHPALAGTEVFVVPPTANARVLPDTILPAELAKRTLNLTASPGEYEPATFVVRNSSSTASIEGVTVTPTGLARVGGGGSISPSEVDIRIVKCWWQAGLEIYDLSHTQLTPELLLKDDTLVRVGSNPPLNELKVSGTYVVVSDPNGVFLDGVRVDAPTSAQFPVQDAGTLQPFDLPPAGNKQLWVTVRVPAGTPPGVYVGSIILNNPGKGAHAISETVTLNVTVPDIALLPPDRTCGVYYRGQLKSEGTISGDGKDTAQFTAEQQNLAAHGVTSPTLYGQGNNTNLASALSIRAASGISNGDLYYLGITIASYGSDTSALEAAILQCRSVTAPYGVNQLFVYGLDESLLSPFTAQIQAVHSAGGKVFCAENTEAKLFDALDSGLDLVVYSRDPEPGVAALCHDSGCGIFNYAMPQGGEEKPATFRRNYGLFLREHDYDGAMTYAYQASFGNGWNDFDHAAFRDHNLTYPAANGVIDTLSWEAYREAVDDLRYAATLDGEIATALGGANPALQREAHDARAWLNTVFALREDPDEIRQKIIRYILRLKGLVAPAEPRLDDLRGHWSFSGLRSLSSVYDDSGWGNAGILMNMDAAIADGSAYDQGKIGRCVALTAAQSQYVDCGKADSLNLPNAITVSAWVRVSSLATSSQIIYCRDEAGARYRLNITPSGALNLYVKTAAQGWHSGGTGQPRTWTDGWHHVAWSYDSATNTAKFYVDGQEDFSSTTLSTGPLSSAPLLWVRVGGGENGIYFNGLLDEVKIHNRALANSEVRALVRDGSLRGKWTLDEPVGAEIAKDASGNGHTGFPSRIMPYSSRVPGKSGRAIRFDRAAFETLDCGKDETLNLSNAITVAAWVKLSGTAADSQIIHCLDELGSRYRLNISSAGRVNLWIKTGTQGWHSGGSGQARTWTDGWHHVAWTYDSASNTTKFYVDGQEDFSSTTLNIGAMSNAPLRWVRLGGSENAVYFNGDLDEACLYDKALTQAEILEIMNP